MALTVAIDLAKTVFELAVADETGRIVERRRVSRRQLEQYFANRTVGKVVMEACGSAHYWGSVVRSPGYPGCASAAPLRSGLCATG